MAAKKILLYSTEWCGDCFHSKHVLRDAGVEFVEINIDKDETAAQKVMDINKGNRSVPTIVFPDGAVLVEPSNMDLKNQLDNFLNN